MSRRYYRRRKKDDLITPIGFILGIIALGEYFKLSNAQKQNLKTGLTIFALLAISLAILFKIARHIQARKRMRALKLFDADRLDGISFEKYVAEILKNRGYSNVKLTEYYDWGVDIVAEKDGVRWGIQVKRYSGPVRVEAVRQVVAGLNKYKCSRAMVVTNSYYNKQAKELARSNNCVLVDRNTLADWIIKFQGKQQFESPQEPLKRAG